MAAKTIQYDGYTATADYDALTLTLDAAGESGDSLVTNFASATEMDDCIARRLR